MICRLSSKVLISRHCVKAESVNTPHNLCEKKRAGKWRQLEGHSESHLLPEHSSHHLGSHSYRTHL